MAIFHLSAKIISRKAGRSSTGAAAYRAGEQVIDERTGEVHDYSRKRGVEHAEIVMPSATDWRPTRAELWNAAELKNNPFMQDLPNPPKEKTERKPGG